MIRQVWGVSTLAALVWLGVWLGTWLGLAGCSPVVAPGPGFQTVAERPPDMVFTLRDGSRLPARAWLPPAGVRWRGVILALHGFIDSRDSWELPAPGFAAAGYAVFAPDQRGFGGAPARGAWPGMRLVDDAAELVAQLRARHPGLPVVVAGESMGGAVAMCLVARNAASRGGEAAPDATVLLAPAVWGWEELDGRLAAALVVASGVAPHWQPDPGAVGSDIRASDNYDALVRLGRDPLTIRRPEIATLRGLVDLMAAAQRAAPHLHGRVLLLDGRRDQIVPPAATAVAWARMPASVRRGFYPNGYHLLLRDRDRALVEADVLAWLDNPDAWLPSGADVAAAAWEADQAWAAGPSEAVPAAQVDGDFGRSVWPY